MRKPCLSRLVPIKRNKESMVHVRFGMLHRHASHCVCCGVFFLETYRPLAIGCLRTQKHALSLIPVPAGFRLSCFVSGSGAFAIQLLPALLRLLHCRADCVHLQLPDSPGRLREPSAPLTAPSSTTRVRLLAFTLAPWLLASRGSPFAEFSTLGFALLL